MVYIIFVILVFITACNYVDWWTYVYLLYGAPYYITKYIVKLKQDGKKLFFFLWDFVIFVFNVQLRKVKLSYDEEVEYHDKKITFK